MRIMHATRRLDRRNRMWKASVAYFACGVMSVAVPGATAVVLACFGAGALFYYMGRPRSKRPGGPSLSVPFARFMQTVEEGPEPVGTWVAPDPYHRYVHKVEYVGLIDSQW
jgi:hypothetical protein